MWWQHTDVLPNLVESSLSTIHPEANVAVIGASGGIGLALTKHLAAKPSIAQVNAIARSSVLVASEKVRHISADVTHEPSVQRAADEASADAPLDLVIVATGILHNGAIQPEKRLAELDPDQFIQVLKTNTLGPALVAKYFLPTMRRGHKTVFAAISARVGSIADNRLGGWASYRASKSALNMLLKTFSIEQARTRPQCIVAALHPGTVATGLSEPFRRNVLPDKLFSPEQSAGYLLDVVDGLVSDDTGGFFAWDGQRIEF